MQTANQDSTHFVFNYFKDSLLALDPVAYCEKTLYLDGKPFRLHGNGYKPFADIYRYIGSKALEKTAKPIVLVKGRQVGATTMAAALELYFATCGLFGNNNSSPIRVIHTFPILEQASKYTKSKLNVMMGNAIQDPNFVAKKGNKQKNIIESKIDTSSASNNSISYKQFNGGNILFIEGTGLDGDRLRLLTADVIFFDEFQDTPSTAVSPIVKSLTKAQYGRPGDGVQVYFGTPKSKTSDYYKIWESSTQQFYHLGCEKCKEFFPLYIYESNEWETIWIEDDLPKDHPSHGFIVKCTKCDHKQDKREAAERGKWIALNDNPNAKFIGYHINQLYNPEFTREKVIGEKPENHPTNTTRAWKNEVLGEFYSDSSSQITIEEIYEMCGDPQRKFIQRITPENNVKAYAGYDWGHREQSENEEADAQNKSRSFNCGVILIPDGSRLSIVYAEYLHKSNLDSKKQFVERLFNKYSVSRAVGDIGDAGDLSKDLQQQYGQKFLVSQSCPKVNGYTTFKEDFFPNRIMFEKDYYIEEVLTMMKKGLIRFPYGNLDQIFWLAKHCSSMETKYSKDRSGEMKKHYVKGSEPNDGFMALINAYLAYKFDITEGFKITNPNLMREGNTLKKQQPNIILANIKNNVVRNYIKPNSNNKFSRN
jgi:ssDNA-binding Zn-finger/Zn-ribbon topoisomerase 1